MNKNELFKYPALIKLREQWRNRCLTSSTLCCRVALLLIPHPHSGFRGPTSPPRLTTARSTSKRKRASQAGPTDDTELPAISTGQLLSQPHPAYSGAEKQPARWSLGKGRLFKGGKPRGYPPASRLLNPINHAPRDFALQSISIEGPIASPSTNPLASQDTHTLLTLPERKQSRQSAGSLVVERPINENDSPRSSIKVPSNRNSRTSATINYRQGMVDLEHGSNKHEEDFSVDITGAIKEPDAGAEDIQPPHPALLKSSEDQDLDIESGQKFSTHVPPKRASLPEPSLRSYTGDADVNDTASYDDGDADFPWGPSHPCFPHQNPHVPLASPLYATTRIIRIKRDWRIAGDLAPTFSNVYPEILDHVLSEERFREIIGYLNEELIQTFDPWNWWNILDGVLGILTFWIWDDLGLGHAKRRLRRVEEWLENWNQGEGVKEGVRLIPLRRTAYLSLDIQIPDPHV
ncbi:MAG: hypothetical protein M1836_002273 [Candelina mexicana]|nr:MAG: hypothetical protein M1836_002273 [Candelina mexicana]